MSNGSGWEVIGPGLSSYLKALEVLGLDPAANHTLEQIKKQYRDLAFEYHPDRAPAEKKEEFVTRFREINAAYQALQIYPGKTVGPVNGVRLEELLREARTGKEKLEATINRLGGGIATYKKRERIASHLGPLYSFLPAIGGIIEYGRNNIGGWGMALAFYLGAIFGAGSWLYLKNIKTKRKKLETASIQAAKLHYDLETVIRDMESKS